MLLSAEMLNMLNHVGDLVWKMCFFLRKCWICWICWMFLEPIGSFAYRFKKHSTYSTYSTFLQKEAHFSNKISNMIQHIQHFCSFELILYKKCFFLQKCWICWICWMFLGLTSSIACRFQKHSTYSTYSTFLQKEAHFSNKISNMIQHIQHFCSFELILYKKCFCLQKCWICWICWMYLGLTSSIACRFQKHSTYSTYSTFLQKEAHF